MVSETPHSPGKYQRTSLIREHEINVKDFRGPSALLIGSKAERPGKHLQQTAAFSLGTPIPHWVYGCGKYPALRTKKQSRRRKPLKSRWPYGKWNRNQGPLVPWVKHDEHSTEKQNSANSRFQRNVCFLGKPGQTDGGNGMKRAKTRPSETTLYKDRLSTIINLRE